MAGLETFRQERQKPSLEPPTETELFSSRILEMLGNSYVLKKRVEKNRIYNEQLTYIHTELLFIRQGLLKSSDERFGAKTLMTFLADGHFIREIETDDDVKKAANSPLQKIEGYLMGEGNKHVYDNPDKNELPPKIKTEIEKQGIIYYMKRHIYLYRNNPWESISALKEEFKQNT